MLFSANTLSKISRCPCWKWHSTYTLARKCLVESPTGKIALVSRSGLMCPLQGNCYTWRWEEPSLTSLPSLRMLCTVRGERRQKWPSHSSLHYT
ncbi:hypothetical protein PoB_005315500 [Plakobranchus ocellatus]|uniref:Uncharacterized protein n=1 Tax=Plakobranchus ocellatus TaxID=259542 RepID=A0AAV4C1W4_9GAST|nr:hypothetical protein PoB_005315500 [Plakobranchus ocellatus]